jgi:NADPH-dependent 2,4-dienoyl-CoA reductase/sulfur reductase-like enzyme/rhodanese-related sulfurtransferase
MSRRIVVVGGVALGSKAACRAKRMDPKAEVTLIDKDKYISYGGCGIPFYISGDVSDISELRSTSFHMIRDEHFFLKDKGVIVMSGTEVIAINRQTKEVGIRHKDGATGILPYDKLVLATGTTPRKLNLPGEELKNIFTVANLHDAMAIKEKITKGRVEKAVIVGGGFIGLEMAEALADMWEIETSIVEISDQIMPGFVSPSLAKMAQTCLEKNGVKVYTSEKVSAFIGEGSVSSVKTDTRSLKADMVIMAAGVVPNTALAKETGLEVTSQGWIVVNDLMQTSDPDIYAGGDCAAIKNLITGEPGWFPLGSMANRQGRVIGTNIAGGEARFEGAVGSFVVKIFDKTLTGAGLTAGKARDAGFEAFGIQVAQFDRAHFYIEKEVIFLELVVDCKTRKVLGIQGYGGKDSGVVGRINAVAPLLKYRPGVEEISNLELAYSPPFASAMDIINAVGNAASNYLDGRYQAITMEEFNKYWQNRSSGEIFFLDCRAQADAQPFADKFPEIWKSIPHDQLRERMDEVPRDKKLVLICNTGVRSYETQLNLNEQGLTNNVNASAGMAGLKTWGVDFEMDK